MVRQRARAPSLRCWSDALFVLALRRRHHPDGQPQPRRPEGGLWHQVQLLQRRCARRSAAERVRRPARLSYVTRAGPAPEKLTDAIFTRSTQITEYHILKEEAKVSDACGPHRRSRAHPADLADRLRRRGQPQAGPAHCRRELPPSPNRNCAASLTRCARSLVLQVIDATVEYAELMRSIFDFAALRTFLQRPDFRLIYDSMHGGMPP
jgi:hypothetical protein